MRNIMKKISYQKKILTILFVIFLSTSFVACGASDPPLVNSPVIESEIVDAEALYVEVESALPETTAPEIITPPLNSINFSVENRDGYEIAIQLSIGEWIRTTDVE